MFSRKPLNYHTFLARIRHAPHQLTPSQLIDAITASRLLQRSKPSASPQNNLGIAIQPSNTQMEAQLRNFLTKHRFHQYDNVLHYYLTDPPWPSNLSTLIDSVVRRKDSVIKQAESNIKQAESNIKPDRSKINPDRSKIKQADRIKQSMGLTKYSKLMHFLRPTASSQINLTSLLFHRMLAARDYSSSFELIEAASVEELKRKHALAARYGAIISSAFTLSAYCELSLSGFEYPMISGLSAALTVFLMLRFTTIDAVTRVRFRLYTSLWYKWMHRNELLMVNKVLTHFEEFNETTVRNFHHSSNRIILGIHDNLSSDWTLESDTDALAPLRQMMREEVQRRRMVVNELDEELLFLEYWLDGDARYRWVDADQDPAELQEGREEIRRN